MISLYRVWMGLVCVLACNGVQAAPLAAEALLTEADTDNFAGPQASPDGRLVAFDVARSTESLEFEYPHQLFTRTGRPMWAGLAIYRGQILDIETGKVVALPDENGASWGGSWSADGQRYAFYSDTGGMSTVRIWDRRTGESRQVSDAVVRQFRNTEAPVWTPDGKTVIFKAVPEGKTLEDMARFSQEYVAELGKNAPSPAQVRVHVYRAPEEHGASNGSEGLRAFLDYRYLSDLVAVDVQSGQLTRLAHAVHPLWFALSPDGRWLAYLNFDGALPNTQRGSFSLHVYSLETNTDKVLDASVVPSDPALVSWSPRSDRVGYATHEGASYNEWGAFIADVHTGKRTRVSPPEGRKFGTLGWGAPLWSHDGETVYLLDTPYNGEQVDEPSHLWVAGASGGHAREIGAIAGRRVLDVVTANDRSTYWSPDGGASMVVRTLASDTQRQGFYRIDVRGGSARLITEVDAKIQRPLLGTDRNTRGFSFFLTDVSHAPELHVLDVAHGAIRRVSRLHPQLLDTRLGSSRLIEWLSPTGERLKGSLLLPPSAKEHERLPLVVWVYGGDHGSESLNAFGFGWGATFNMQMLATRGYAVLYPDVPIHDGRPVRDVADAVLSGVNRVIELGLADPDRLAVMGQSFGGYNTVAILTQTTRFKAAVITGSAAIDAFEGYARFESGNDSGTGYYEQGQGALRATPWDKPLRYLENSPSFFLDRVETPLMIVRGTSDSISMMNGSIFNSLRRLGKTAEFLEYENEGHVIQQPRNMVDLWNRRIAWLDRYLRPQPIQP